MNVVLGVKGFVAVPLAERFWSKVRKTNSCWLWLGATDGRYGQIWVNGRNERAHRISWEMLNGVIPEGLDACHTCDNPRCVNPSHIFLGTAHDNAVDAESKGRLNHKGYALRTHCKHGHAYTKENTYVYPSGKHRQCLICRRAFKEKYKRMRKLQKAA